MCDRNPASSVALGALNGFLAIFGASNFFNPVNESEMQKVSKALQETQQRWQTAISQQQNKITQDCFQLLRAMINAGDQNQKVVEVFLGNQIKKNTLLIYMLIGMVAMLVVFDLALPSFATGAKTPRTKG